MLKTFRLIVLCALFGLLFGRPVAAAGPDASAFIDQINTVSCAPLVCSVYIHGYCAPTFTVQSTYKWNPLVKFQYFHQGVGAWLDCGYGSIGGIMVGSRIPVSTTTGQMFYKSNTYKFRIYAEVLWTTNGAVAQIVTSPTFSYTIPGS